MSRTDKYEHHSPDTYRIGHKLERQARQPQRNRVAFAADLALEGNGDDAVLDLGFETLDEFEARMLDEELAWKAELDEIIDNAARWSWVTAA